MNNAYSEGTLPTATVTEVPVHVIAAETRKGARYTRALIQINVDPISGLAKSRLRLHGKSQI